MYFHIVFCVHILYMLVVIFYGFRHQLKVYHTCAPYLFLDDYNMSDNSPEHRQNSRGLQNLQTLPSCKQSRKKFTQLWLTQGRLTTS